MAAKRAHDAARAKAAKEKKILLALLVPLAGAAFFAYHTLSGRHSTPTTAPAAAATTPASATPSIGPIMPPSTSELAALGELRSKDPFGGSVGQAPASTSPSPSFTAAPTGGGTQSQPSQPHPQQSQPKPTQPKPTQPTKPQQKKLQPKKVSPPPSAAVIVLDMTLVRIHRHKPFGYAYTPSGTREPLFWVVWLTHKTARIVAIGKMRAHTLKVDQPVTLKDPQGIDHTLMLLPEGTPLPTPASQTKAAPAAASGKQGG